MSHPTASWTISTSGSGGGSATKRTLVYHYDLGAWTTFGTSGVDAVIHDGVYYWLKSDGTVYKERSDTTYLDGATQFDTIIKTPWVRVQDLQEWQRVRRLIVLGDFPASGESSTLDIAVYYDYSDTADYTVSEAMAGKSTVRHRLRKQKCRAVRFDITLNADANGDGMTFVQLALEMAPKGGLARLGSSNTV